MRVLYVIAHPDDEDSVTLTHLAGRCRVPVAVFSVTRGEGGANLVGPEQDEALGLRRTLELVAACREYGVDEVFFSSAFDYGFSRRIAEAEQKWNVATIEDELAVAIDRWRPTLVMCRFSGHARDGHAHHRITADIVRRVVKGTSVDDVLYGEDNIEASRFPDDVVAQARRGFRCHKTQDPERLLAAGAAGPCRYRSSASGALIVASELPVPSPEHDHTAPHDSSSRWLPVTRASPFESMYRWRKPGWVLRPLAPSDAAPPASPTRPEPTAPANLVVQTGTVGYIAGDGDGIDESLGRMGVVPRIITDSSQLAGCDTVLVGTRAYSAQPWLRSATGEILEYVSTGGHVVVLRQVSPYSPEHHAPYYGHMPPEPEEVCEEDSPVVTLDPTHEFLNRPNVITADDFDGWINERGSKFWSDWASEYQPLLELRDLGEPAQLGGWLTAASGAGRYTYCALALPRQLRAGVPGAYRLLANLIRPLREADER